MSASILLRFIPSTEVNIWFESSADKSVNHALPGITRNTSIFYFAVESYILKFRIISNFWKYVRMRLIAKKKKKNPELLFQRNSAGDFTAAGWFFTTLLVESYRNWFFDFFYYYLNVSVRQLRKSLKVLNL